MITKKLKITFNLSGPYFINVFLALLNSQNKYSVSHNFIKRALNVCLGALWKVDRTLVGAG